MSVILYDSLDDLVLQNQMANWNKMIAYINFFLLLFLMVLILIVVIGMNYYQLANYYHNHPEDQSAGFIPSSPSIA